MSIKSLILYLAISLVQFQNLSLSLASSRYDLTSFIFIFLVFRYLSIKQLNSRKTLYVFLFIIFQVIVWLNFQYAPFHRLASGLIWFGGLVIIFLFGSDFKYNRKHVFFLLQFWFAFLSLIVILQKFILQYPRPLGFMDEPSLAGLLLVGGLAMNTNELLTKESNKGIFKSFNLLMIILLAFSAFLTKTSHIITYLISLCIVLFSVNNKTWLIKSSTILALLLLPLFVFFDSQHYLDRFYFSDISDISNISTLSWLRGFSQVSHVISESPLFGFGLGSIGYFPFQSDFSVLLEKQGVGYLNLYDSYSGFFRVIIELGTIGPLTFLSYIVSQIINFCQKSYQLPLSMNDNYSKPLFILGITLLFGFLIKEPAYGRSFVSLSIFLITSNRISPRC